LDIRNIQYNIFKPIKDYIPHFDFSKVLGTYEDLINVSVVSNNISEKRAGNKTFKLIKSGEKGKVSELWQYDSQLITLLKTSYLLSSIFINVFIGELTGNRKLTLRSFLGRKIEPYNQINTNEILQAYCIVLYRHKLIAHHEFYRTDGAAIDEEVGSIKYLHPTGIPTQFPESEINRVESLKEKYSVEFQKLKDYNNNYELTKYLFYNIPIGSIGDINPDRNTIDQLVEKTGVPSFTQTQIIIAIDHLIIEFYRIIKKYLNE